MRGLNKHPPQITHILWINIYHKLSIMFQTADIPLNCLIYFIPGSWHYNCQLGTTTIWLLNHDHRYMNNESINYLTGSRLTQGRVSDFDNMLLYNIPQSSVCLSSLLRLWFDKVPFTTITGNMIYAGISRSNI